MVLNDTTGTASTNPQGLIQKAWRAYKGNTSWPAAGSAKYLMMVMIANDLKNNWALDSKVHWDSLFSQNSNIGTISATVQSYNLPASVFYLSDYVYILRLDGNLDRFQVVHPESRNNYNSALPGAHMGGDDGEPAVFLTGCFKGGAGNMAINFVEPFQTITNGVTYNSPDVGGTIQAGTYVVPPDMVNNTDVVPVNNPEWLVYALAAELARNDPAKQDQYPYLNGIANDLYSKMVLDNQGNSYQQPNGPAYMLKNPGVTWQQV